MAACRVFAIDIIVPPLVYRLRHCHSDTHAERSNNVAPQAKTELVGELEDGTGSNDIGIQVGGVREKSGYGG